MNLRTELHHDLLNIIEELIEEDRSSQASEYLAKLKNIYSQDDFRHIYSDFYPILSKYTNKIQELYLDANLSAIINEIPENESKEKYASGIIKLYDHLNIDLTRMEQQKAAVDANENLEIRFKKLEKAESELSSKIRKAEENLEKSKLDIVAVLGIFSAIVIAFFGGFNYITAAISAMNNSNIGTTILVISVDGFIVFNTIVAVIRLATRQSKDKETENKWIACINVIIVTFITIALVLYLK